MANDIKIIIGIFDLQTTVKLFCEVYKLNMYGENYQWIILGTYNREMLFENYTNLINCTTEQLLIALNGTLQTRVVQYSYEYDQSQKKSKPQHQSSFDRQYTVIVNSYISKIKKSLNRNNDSSCLNDYFHGYAFDALLSTYKALSSLIEDGNFSCRHDTFIRNIEWFKILNNAFNRISFEGVTVII